MAKNLKVNLQFTADTGQARAQLQQLTAQLNTLTSTTASNLKITPEIQKAQQAAIQLKTALAQAVNVDTGKFDLVKFSSSLTKMGTNLSALKTQLVSLGPSGQQAFMSLAQSIMQAEIPMQRLSKHLTSLKNTIANTLRWQISSSLLHGIAGEISTAFRYAQDLNESLNNIRIVTGQNVDGMAKFAREANKAAKALSTTTTKYTDASLIYYQQGLSDEEVKQRTDITIKMANVAGESVETVSNQLPAVWNNFDNGTKSLEYYADVMTALGAATASSVDEITGGLEKFAAIGDTIGLSFEYAASALATITSNTRQSEEVVGTALKTIFARIQGLKLGETLDDGTSLNKYSEALAKVGISIFESNGELKAMDNILYEMAVKWDSLNNAQQTALAQTVAGVRQYTQLVALMENWDNGDNDSMMANLNTSYGSTGALQEQADIYAESWEAAQARVKASLETLYNELIPTDFLISLTDAGSDILDGLSVIVDGFGGLGNILLLISNIALHKFAPSIITGLNSGFEKAQGLIGSFQNLKTRLTESTYSSKELETHLNGITGEKIKTAADSLSYYDKHLKSASSSSLQMSQSLNQSALATEGLSEAFKLYLADTSQVYNLQALIEKNTKNLNAAEKERLSTMQQQLLVIANEKKELQNEISLLETQLKLRIQSETATDIYGAKGYKDRNFANVEGSKIPVKKEYDQALTLYSNKDKGYGNWIDPTIKANKASFTSTSVDGIVNAGTKATQLYSNIETINAKINNILQQQGVSLKEQIAAAKQIVNTAETDKQINKEIQQTYIQQLEAVERSKSAQLDQNAAVEVNQGIVQKLRLGLIQSGNEVRQIAQGFGVSDEHLKNVLAEVIKIVSLQDQQAGKQAEWNSQLNNTKKILMGTMDKFKSMGSYITSAAQGISTLTMGYSMVSNAIKTLNDDTADFETKLTSVGFAIPMLIQSFGVLSSGLSKLNIINLEFGAIKNFNIKLLKKELGMNSAIFQQRGVMAALKKAGLNDDKAQSVMNVLLEKQKEKGNKLTEQEIKLELIKQKINFKKLGILLLIAAAITAVILAIRAYIKAQNAEAESAKRAAEAAEELKKQTDEAKQSLQNLTSAFDDYKNIVNALEECTEGTDKWNEALTNVNNKIWELLETYPELAKLPNLFDENGLLNQEAINDYIADQQTKVNDLQAATLTAQARSTKANYQVQESDFKNALGSFAEARGMGSGWANQVTAEVLDAYRNNATAGEIEKIISGYSEKLYLNTDYLNNEFDQLAQQLRDLGQAAVEADNQMSNVGHLIGQQLLGNDATEMQLDQFNETFNATENTRYNEIISGAGINAWSSRNDADVKDLWNKYQEIMGTDYKLASNAIVGNDDYRYFQYKDEKGEKVQIPIEQIAEAIAAAEAKTEAEGQIRTDLLDKAGLSDQINEDVSTELLNTVLQRFNLNNKDTKDYLDAQLNANQTAEEQKEILNEILQNSMNDKEREELESSTIASSSASKYELDSEIIAEQAKQLHNLHEEQGLTLVETTKLAV